jgi:hypothetical protein
LKNTGKEINSQPSYERLEDEVVGGNINSFHSVRYEVAIERSTVECTLYWVTKCIFDAAATIEILHCININIVIYVLLNTDKNLWLSVLNTGLETGSPD